ncbi:MAG TPA: hypothetical protein VEG34_07155 [Thermoanaerobaculia bacterium]|nr:hypothetical protein [Thermoanaerobaculia bacterium]
MRFLLVKDGSDSKAAQRLCGDLARLAHAQVTVLETGADLGEAAERQPCDLVVLTPPAREGLETAERVLRGGQHHLLLVPETARTSTIPLTPARNAGTIASTSSRVTPCTSRSQSASVSSRPRSIHSRAFTART